MVMSRVKFLIVVMRHPTFCASLLEPFCLQLSRSASENRSRQGMALSGSASSVRLDTCRQDTWFNPKVQKQQTVSQKYIFIVQNENVLL